MNCGTQSIRRWNGSKPSNSYAARAECFFRNWPFREKTQSWFDGGTDSLQIGCKSLPPLCNKMSTMQELFETSKKPWHGCFVSPCCCVSSGVFCAKCVSFHPLTHTGGSSRHIRSGFMGPFLFQKGIS